MRIGPIGERVERIRVPSSVAAAGCALSRLEELKYTFYALDPHATKGLLVLPNALRESSRSSFDTLPRSVKGDVSLDSTRKVRERQQDLVDRHRCDREDAWQCVLCNAFYAMRFMQCVL